MDGISRSVGLAYDRVPTAEANEAQPASTSSAGFQVADFEHRLRHIRTRASAQSQAQYSQVPAADSPPWSSHRQQQPSQAAWQSHSTAKLAARPASGHASHDAPLDLRSRGQTSSQESDPVNLFRQSPGSMPNNTSLHGASQVCSGKNTLKKSSLPPVA